MSESPPTNPHLSAAGRVSVLTRHRGPNHPDVIAARAELREARLREAIAREAEADPPLSPEQRARLAVLLLRSGRTPSEAA
jgi:hypothetical protein